MWKVGVLLMSFAAAALHSAEVVCVLDFEVRQQFEQMAVRLQASPAHEILFEESRRFPFRRTPVVLSGVIRLLDGRGISIEYPEKRSVLIADQAGVLMRKFSKDGALREKVVEMDASDTIGLLQVLFEFDTDRLAGLFDATWAPRDEGAWVIALTPRVQDPSSLEAVTLSGVGAHLKLIDVDFKGKKRMSIRPVEEHALEGFSAEVRMKYFRNVEG